MAIRGVSFLKFVGTVSLGLLTGLSYTLSTLTVPTLLTLPSASTAARAFRHLASTAKRQLRALTFASAVSFALAFVLSPRHHRHPYLLYTSALALGSGIASSDKLAPYLFLSPRAAASSIRTTATTASPPSGPHIEAAARRERAARARMEASYEVLGSSDSHSDGGAGSADEEEALAAAQAAGMNGEEVRGEVEGFVKKQLVRTGVAGLGFLVAVLGIWGDGASRPAAAVYRS